MEPGTEADYSRIGTRTIGNIPVRVIDHVGIIQVERVAVRTHLHGLSLAACTDHYKGQHYENIPHVLSFHCKCGL